MCLNLNRYSRVLTSKRDIIVYKRVNLEYNNPDKFTSPFFNSVYVIGKKKTVKNFFVVGWIKEKSKRFEKRITDKLPKGSDLVHNGLHAFRTYQKAIIPTFSGNTVIKCKIPAGTPYIYGTNEEVVSLALLPVSWD